METASVWRKLSFFISSSHSQNYLSHCYKQLGIPDYERRSFENCYPFIYYLEHGKSYYELSRISPLSIKPVLLFYGMIQLLKACLLTVDPNYPESTSVLAHGVTTRKRKKQSYEFLQDEVKIQRNGLFTHIAEQMFHMKHLEGEKFTMEVLLKRVGELKDLFTYSKKAPELYAVKRVSDTMISVPKPILDRYNMTEDRFIEYFQSSCSHLDIHPEVSQNTKDYIYFRSSLENWNGLLSSPLTYDFYTNTHYLPINRELMNVFPEMLVHYLLLYNLSMISRYETEWWSELLHSYSTEDYPFIHQFLSVSSDKIPYYIYLYLITKTK
ncbi:YaaC family protein [Ectobacillus panaciterrae]|uniref:YaaC family protein n=1 Tax=Ectobacillus panaciterrae TaxID=363872 RepID=UPI00048D2B86|nr:YaaC family protein [Ectobacillus panaciterrae]